MSDFVKRLEQEHQDLNEKIEKLISFSKTDKFSELPLIEQKMLLDQLKYMSRYAGTLHLRCIYYRS
jgi:hypothetical protein